MSSTYIFFVVSGKLRTMSENNCYLCQEPKSVVGHNTQSCPNVKCKKCGQKGHIYRNCPSLSFNIDRKADDVYSKEMRNDIAVILHNNSKTLKFAKAGIKRKCDLIDEETLKAKSSKIDQINPVMPNDKEMLDFAFAIEFSDDVKPKLEIMEEPLKLKSEILEKPKISQFICDVCNFEAPDQNLLELHFTKKHGQQDGQSVRAPDLSNNKLMRNIKMLQETLKVKNSGIYQKPNRIDPTQCPKAYLNEHMKNQISEKPKKLSRFNCDVCNFEAPDQDFLDLHIDNKHRQQDVPDQSNKPIRRFEMSQESSNYYCDICHVKGYRLSLSEHLAGKKHLENEILEMKSEQCKAPSLINGAHQNSNGLQEKSKLTERVVEGTTKKTPLTGYFISYIPLDLNHTSKKPKISRFFCDICNFEAPDQGFLDLHSTIEHRHQGVPDQSNKLIRKLHKSKESYNYYCDICHVKGYTLSLSEHLAGKKHLEMESKRCKAPSLINGANQNSNGLQEKSKQGTIFILRKGVLRLF